MKKNKPSSVFFHVDVNSAYLSWEASRRKNLANSEPDLRDIPSAVGGSEEDRHGIVLAKSEPAKKFGIKTGESLMMARKKCPELKVVPANFSLYVNKSNELIKFLNTYSDKVIQYSIDEAFMDMTGMERLYGNPIETAHMIKGRIEKDLAYTVNVGVGENKLLAKIASNFEKPNKVCTLFFDEIEDKLWPLPIENLFYIGKKSKKKLKNLGILTIGDLARSDRDFILKHFDKPGLWMWNHANGFESENFLNQNAKSRSYGNSLTTPHNVKDRKTAKYYIISLCETLCYRIRRDKIKVRVVSLSLRDSNFESTRKQVSLDSPTNSTNKIIKIAMELFDKIWRGQPIRQIGVYTSKAFKHDARQISFFEGRYDKEEKIDRIVDEIRNKYGDASIKRACFINSEINHMTGGACKERRGGIIVMDRPLD